VTDDVGTLYEHGVRALERGLRFGQHGLPLMGCGDWNDGMNLVGQHGRGESVWLAFFLFHVLTQFAALARRRGDVALADRYTVEAGRLRGSIEEHGWDGQWYRRAYFDDGTPLGSAENEECQIDAISQSWSVLSGAGTPERTEAAMASVDRRLVRRDDRLILLLDPPFDKSDLNPGYIKGYVPGVRENGGQYTHSAIWTVMAAAARGDSERAWELFRLINPVSHGTTPAETATYRVEPYVVAADVYGSRAAHGPRRLDVVHRIGRLDVPADRRVAAGPAHRGRQAAHRAVPARRMDRVQDPLPLSRTFYHITIHHHGPNATVSRLTLDGAEQSDDFITLIDDGQDHQIEVEMRVVPWAGSGAGGWLLAVTDWGRLCTDAEIQIGVRQGHGIAPT
jgi:cyclic beta-1,2-glucan synthetase